MSNVRTQIGKAIGKSLNSYHSRIKPKIDELRFKEQYQGRIIDCMVGEVDDNYIETPLTDENVVKLEHSKDGVVKIARIKGKTILVDEEGNETDTPGEGCKLVSVGEEEDNKLIILSKNKNLFDGKLEFGSIGAYTGIDAPTQNGNRSIGFTKIKGGVKYYVTKKLLEEQQRHLRFIYYNENKEHIGYSDLQYNRNVITTPNNACYLRLKYDLPEKFYDISIVEGETPTSYIEPKQHKTEILLDEPLRSLPNGVCDEIVGNKLIRRIGVKIFNGNESWRYFSPSSASPPHPTGEGFFRIVDNIFVDNVKSQSDLTNGYCNLFNINKNFYDAHFYSNLQGIGWQNYFGSKYIFIRATMQFPNNNVDDFKRFLNDNNAILYYELEEPIIEELPNGITLQGFDDTTMYIENSITPTVQYGYNALIPYKQELLNQKEEVETNTLDIEQNIIPYLMDMEFNLMLMEDE